MYKAFYNPLILALLSAVFLNSCGLNSCGRKSEKGEKDENADKHNFIILLDLSDRIILGTDQINTDKRIINSVWKQFRDISKSNYLKSRDKFQIVVAHQDSSTLSLNQKLAFQDSMTLDLSEVKIHATNRTVMDKFGSGLQVSTDKLYQLASVSKNPDDYYGADIWKFFDEEIQYRLKKGYKNHVFILTDGYLFVKEKRDELAPDFPPVRFKTGDFFVDVCMLGITPKNTLDDEFYRLKNLWSDWFAHMDIKEMQFLQLNNLSLIENQINDFLNSEDRSAYMTRKMTQPLSVKKPVAKETEQRRPELVAKPIERKKTKNSDTTSALSDSEFLYNFVSDYIYNPGSAYFKSRLVRVSTILEKSFPGKRSDAFVLTCSCKSQLKEELNSRGLMSSTLESNFKKYCP
jgi:hypothetical protein